MPDVDLKPLEEMFRAKVFKMLKEDGKIDDDIIKKGYRRPGRASLQAGDIPVLAYTIRRGLQEMTKKDGLRLPNILFGTASPLRS